ncbi:MAG: thiamine pyrophosphate-binding protein [Ruminococcus sp.]|jgi:acetolactate synthase-1/2/3 large subunit
MKKKVSDYIADYIAARGIRDVFTVTGGGAMHMNDSFGHHPILKCTYHHHEQAAAMAAEAYARVDNQMAAVCVTSGPGATNALTGVLCAWTDSIPMIVFSGQVRYDTTVRSSGLKLRVMGVQEYDIALSAAPMTKYAVMVTRAEDIRYHLERALYLAVHGRPGPVWLDIPLNVQGAMIEPDSLRKYDPEEDRDQVPESIPWETAVKVLAKIQASSRPVVFVGNGVRLARGHASFRQLADLLGVPLVTGMSSVDAVETDHPLYVGRNGGTGDRAGNFAIQNCDLLLSLGSRQSFLQTGFQYETWARAAYTILNDIDGEELKKPSLHVDMPVVGNVLELIEKMLVLLIKTGFSREKPLFHKIEWLSRCRKWKEQYPVVTREHYRTVEEGRTNIYAFFHEMTALLDEEAKLVVSVGTSRVAGSQSAVIKRRTRFITNPNTASMGYGLPAAIGVCRAAKEEVICVTGEGSLQMNLQELQTIVQNRFPIKIFVINNEGYHSIRQTQMNFFGEPLVGVGPESGDLSFPDLEKLAWAYGIPYASCRSSDSLSADIEAVLKREGAVICQVFVTKQQYTQPKTASKRLPDGRMVSAPLEDMYPFLEREELKENMMIDLVDEEM